MGPKKATKLSKAQKAQVKALEKDVFNRDSFDSFFISFRLWTSPESVISSEPQIH